MGFTQKYELRVSFKSVFKSQIGFSVFRNRETEAYLVLP